MNERYVAWVGRLQPFHVGHLSILRRSLETWDLPHVNGIVCHDYDLLDGNLPAKHSRAYNPFTPWEQYAMIRLAVAALGLSDRIDTVFIPYLRVTQWGATRRYLPARFLMGTTNKDADDLAKVAVWGSLGWESAELDVADMQPVSASDVRRAVLAGRAWQDFIPDSTHDYFASIDGPARLLRSAIEVLRLE
jgi:nicotinamide mononucleotide adenylyltransferase